jgi:hypothetical protein
MFWRMSEAAIPELKRAVEDMHGVTAKLVQSVPVHEQHEGKTVWYGTVHVFDIVGRPDAHRAYAWSYDLPSGERRFFAVLHLPPIAGPVDAVRAAIVQEQRMEKYGRTPTGKTEP